MILIKLPCSIFIEIALECYISRDFFEIKFLHTGDPKNADNIGLKAGLSEILASCANSLHHKVGKKKGITIVQELISDNVMETFNVILERYNFKKGLTMKKYLEEIKSGSKFVSTPPEEGCSLLENNNDDNLDSNEGDNNIRSSNEINDNFIAFEKIIIEEMCISSDSSISGEHKPI